MVVAALLVFQHLRGRVGLSGLGQLRSVTVPFEAALVANLQHDVANEVAHVLIFMGDFDANLAL